MDPSKSPLLTRTTNGDSDPSLSLFVPFLLTSAKVLPANVLRRFASIDGSSAGTRVSVKELRGGMVMVSAEGLVWRYFGSFDFGAGCPSVEEALASAMGREGGEVADGGLEELNDDERGGVVSRGSELGSKSLRAWTLPWEGKLCGGEEVSDVLKLGASEAWDEDELGEDAKARV